jgi:hypothetical protein
MFHVQKRYFLELGIILIFLFLFSFILNFVWESFHAVYLYEKHDLEASTYIPMILYVSMVDSLIIEALYLISCILLRKLFWIREFNPFQVLLFFICGLLTAGIIEYRAVYLIHRWSYNPRMPTLLGIGISPLLQLGLTGLISLWLTKQIIYGKGLINK